MYDLPTITQLKLFVIYSQTCDYGAAAQQANILVDEFSAQMQELELLLGTKLIIRDEHHSHLTQEGILFAQEAEAILNNLSAATKKFRATIPQDATVIKVGSLMSMGDILLDQDLLYFESMYPHIKLQIFNHEASDLCELIKANELDVAVLFNLEHLDLDLNNYQLEPYISESLVYYAPNLNKMGATITLEEITPVPAAEYPTNFIMSKLVHQYLANHNTSLNTIAWFTTPYAILSYCQQYLVGSLQCERLLNQFGFYDGYYHIDQELTINYSLLYKKNNRKKEAINTFLSFLKEKHNM